MGLNFFLAAIKNIDKIHTNSDCLAEWAMLVIHGSIGWHAALSHLWYSTNSVSSLTTDESFCTSKIQFSIWHKYRYCWGFNLADCLGCFMPVRAYMQNWFDAKWWQQFSERLCMEIIWATLQVQLPWQHACGNVCAKDMNSWLLDWD